MPSTSAASCDADNRITPSLIGGQRKAPCSSRFQNNTSPDPSQARILSRWCPPGMYRRFRLLDRLAGVVRAPVASLRFAPRAMGYFE
jgi:hypothetical protein